MLIDRTSVVLCVLFLAVASFPCAALAHGGGVWDVDAMADSTAPILASNDVYIAGSARRTPFGGSKASGIGRDGGPEYSFEFYMETKNIAIAYDTHSIMKLGTV